MRDALERLVNQLWPGYFKGSMRIYLEHGLVVVEDRDSSARYDEYVPGGQPDVVRVRENSLCITAQIYVDGAVSVFVLSETVTPELGFLIVDGEIEVPGGWLRIEDSDAAARLLIRARPGVVELSVRVDYTKFPECVLVSIK